MLKKCRPESLGCYAVVGVNSADSYPPLRIACLFLSSALSRRSVRVFHRWIQALLAEIVCRELGARRFQKPRGVCVRRATCATRHHGEMAHAKLSTLLTMFLHMC